MWRLSATQKPIGVSAWEADTEIQRVAYARETPSQVPFLCSTHDSVSQGRWPLSSEPKGHIDGSLRGQGASGASVACHT